MANICYEKFTKQREVKMANTIEKLALCNANLSTEYVELQKKYETLRENLEVTRSELSDTNGKLIIRDKALRELRANSKSLTEEIQSLKCRLAQYEPQINAPMRNGKGSGTVRATPQDATEDDMYDMLFNAGSSTPQQDT